jgi:branched-chain amino acid transport system substrate-binding protein
MKNFGKLCIATVVAGMAGGVMARSRSSRSAISARPQAHFGKDDENGVRMAIEDLNAKGMEIGGKKVKFVLAGRGRCGRSQAGTAAARCAMTRWPGRGLNSGVAIPSSRCSDCGIPMITGAATNPDLTKPGWNTTYRVIANDNALGAALPPMRPRISSSRTWP